MAIAEDEEDELTDVVLFSLDSDVDDCDDDGELLDELADDSLVLDWLDGSACVDELDELLLLELLLLELLDDDSEDDELTDVRSLDSLVLDWLLLDSLLLLLSDDSLVDDSDDDVLSPLLDDSDALDDSAGGNRSITSISAVDG